MDFPSAPECASVQDADYILSHKKSSVNTAKKRSKKKPTDLKLNSLLIPVACQDENSYDDNIILPENLKRACSLKIPLIKQREGRQYGSAFLEALNEKCDDEALCPDLQDALELSDEGDTINASSSMDRLLTSDDPLSPCNTGMAEELGLPQGAPQWAVRSRSTKSFKSFKSFPRGDLNASDVDCQLPR